MRDKNLLYDHEISLRITRSTIRDYLRRERSAKLLIMPPENVAQPDKTLEQIVDEVGLYPVEAFEFVQQGLSYTVNKIHGNETDSQRGAKSRHIGGQDLCEGLREFALQNWGLLAGTVLGRWNVRKTVDFGRIVFAMVDNGFLQKTENDKLDDFRNVFDFKSAFEGGYKIEVRT